MNTDAQHTRTSKFLSLVLRHEPGKIGLALDESGWATVDELLAKAAAAGQPITRELLHAVVAGNDKQRFAFSEDGQRIRASQGHSVAVDLDLPPASPPAVLYHGTATRFLDAIMAEGLSRRARQHVHLSDTVAPTLAVAERHGKPALLRVDALRMAAQGYLFYRSANGVWLTEAVPPQYLALVPNA